MMRQVNDRTAGQRPDNARTVRPVKSSVGRTTAVGIPPLKGVSPLVRPDDRAKGGFKSITPLVRRLRDPDAQSQKFDLNHRMAAGGGSFCGGWPPGGRRRAAFQPGEKLQIEASHAAG